MTRSTRQIQYDIGELQRELGDAQETEIQAAIEQTTKDILQLGSPDERNLKLLLNDLKYKIVDIVKQ